jgi:hypothetical protein
MKEGKRIAMTTANRDKCIFVFIGKWHPKIYLEARTTDCLRKRDDERWKPKSSK